MISSEYAICAALAKSGLFDAQFYLARYPDAVASGLDPVLHYVRYGAAEKRICSPDGFNPAILNIVPGAGASEAAERQTIPVVFAVNEPFIKYLGVALTSLLANFNDRDKLEIFILHNGLRADKFAPILKLQGLQATIRPIDVSGFELVRQRLHISHHISIETYFRFLIPDLFPQYKKLVYLDSDLVVEDDIAELFKFDVSGHVFGGVHDYIFDVPAYKSWRQSMPKGSTDNYFNAGVMLLNLEQTRELRLVEKWFAEAASGKEYLHWDQDIINIVCAGKIMLLPARWNFHWQIYANEHYKRIDRKRVLEYILTMRSPAIVHFASPNKPWNYNDGHFARHFWKYAKLSPCYSEIRQECPYDPGQFLEDA